VKNKLKFRDVTEAVLLDYKSAQYVLREGILRGMPPAGTSGRHREFTILQARRLAIGTRLLMAGVPLRHVWRIIRYCETEVARLEEKKTSAPDLFAPGGIGPWCLYLTDEVMATVWRECFPGADYSPRAFSLAYEVGPHEEHLAEWSPYGPRGDFSTQILDITAIETELVRQQCWPDKLPDIYQKQEWRT